MALIGLRARLGYHLLIVEEGEEDDVINGLCLLPPIEVHRLILRR